MPSLPALAFHGALAATVLGSPATAGDTWVRVRSPHFEVLSDAGEAPAREAARRFERLRVVLLRLFPVREDVARPITFLLIESGARFSSLIPRERSRGEALGGFFQGGDERDYAVLHLSPLQARPFEAAEHELAHLILNSSLPAQPLWVAEGLADLVSDAVLEGDEARLGAARPEYEEALRSAPGLALERLLVVRYDSPEYRGIGDAGLLYAGAWALVRWVVHGHGLDGLRAWLETAAGNPDPEAAFGDVFGSLAAAGTTLLDVPAAPLLRVSLAGVPDSSLESSVPTAADVEQRLGDLLLHGGHTRAARRHLEAALEADPGHVASRTSLGDFFIRQGDWQAGREQLEAALEAEPGNPAALLRLARLEVSQALLEGVELSDEAEERVVAALERALARAPELTDAALLLAGLRPQPYAQSIARLEPLFEQQPDRTEIARAIHGLYLKLGDVPAARRVLEQAREAARDPADRYLAEHLLERLDGFKTSTAEARGDLVHLKCRPDGSLLFTISADPQNLKLEAASTESFFVYGADGLGARAQLVCGEQDRPVRVRYEPGGVGELGRSGRLLWLTFEGSSPPLVTR
jgi:tetratricopeptide (TPR) repeat protein